MHETFEDDDDDDADEYVYDDDDPGYETDEEDAAPSRWGRIVKIIALVLAAGIIVANIGGCWQKLVEHFGG